MEKVLKLLLHQKNSLNSVLDHILFILDFVYGISLCSLNLRRKFPLSKYLFDAVKLNKGADPDKYSYSGYGIRFDTCVTFFIVKWSWVWYKCNEIWS